MCRQHCCQNTRKFDSDISLIWGERSLLFGFPWTFFATLGLGAVCAYLIGSLNSAIIVSRILYGKDVREMGSGNAGMTNVLRNFDKKGAVFTMLGDTLKGVVTALLGMAFIWLLAPGQDYTLGGYAAGVFCVVGHMYPVYFKFKGGKGIATSLGICLAMQPVTAVVLLAVFGVVVLVSRMVSLGSVIAVICYPIAVGLWRWFVEHKDPVWPVVCIGIIMLLALWQHRSNIVRILTGKEYKFGQKKKEEAAAAQEAGPAGEQGE